MTTALSADTARKKTALEDCELKIKSAFRRGLEATCVIAKELHKIYQEELYTAITEDFNEYITDYLQIDQRTYRRIIAVSQTVHQLQEAGLELPANESQAAELSLLDAPLRARVWGDLVIRAEREDKTLTLNDVKRAVQIAGETATARVSPRGKADVEIEMDEGTNGSQAAAPAAKKKSPEDQEAVLVLTEKGEAALARIRKVCGDKIATAIATGLHAMTEREIRNWAEYDDEMMRQLVFFVFGQRYTLARAVAFINREISGSTDVNDLILIANSRGGKAVINYENRARIVIDLETPK